MAIMKRMAAPAFWPVPRKKKKFIAAPLPGPHGGHALTLTVILRDILHYAENSREVREILKPGNVRVNGKARRQPGFPVGLMDILELDSKEGKEHYRVMPGRKGLFLQPVAGDEAEKKLGRISGKGVIAGSRIQLHLHDGSNIIAEKNEYRKNDVLVLASGRISDVYRFEKGAPVLITAGDNLGRLGKIDEIIVTRSPMPNLVRLSLEKEKKEIALPENYVFVVGKKER